MKTLFIGGIKSGKSKNAEAYTLAQAQEKPIYLATTEFIDKELSARIEKHKRQREERFITIEEPLKLSRTVAASQEIVLIECLSMWINNMLYHEFPHADIYEEVERLLALEKDIVFVINDVGSCIIPDNALAREFLDLNGRIAQMVASACDAVYHTVAGISTKIK